MFELGWGELVVIGIVALIAIGPKELPTVLRTLGQWMGKIRRMAAEFQGQFQEALREAELTDLKKQADDCTVSRHHQLRSDGGHAEGDGARLRDAGPGCRPRRRRAIAEPRPRAAPRRRAMRPPPAGTAEVTPLPEINVPLPELPAPVTEKDFAPAEPPPAKETKKQAGGGA